MKLFQIFEKIFDLLRSLAFITSVPTVGVFIKQCVDIVENLNITINVEEKDNNQTSLSGSANIWVMIVERVVTSTSPLRTNNWSNAAILAG